MRQRVRCSECRHWSDALLVWAAGDSCPTCNAPITDFDHIVDETGAERTMHPGDRLSASGLDRLTERT
jgi:hypothetical protein